MQFSEVLFSAVIFVAIKLSAKQCSAVVFDAVVQCSAAKKLYDYEISITIKSIQ